MKTTRRHGARRASIARHVSTATAVGVASLLFAAAAGASSPLTVSSQTIGNMGKVLVVKGKAAYTLSPSGSTCTGLCLKIWPAVTESAKTAKAGGGVKQSKLGVTSGSNGTHQITYGGHKLYWFSGDTKGTVKGNITDQWGTWTAVVVAKPKGTSSGSGGTPTTSSNTGSGANAGGGGVNF
jgi:predicted lipoprotein with Yx(FWY)xxD motif